MGQYYKTNQNQFLDYGYQLPVDTLAGALRGADARRDQQLSDADALDDALNVNALDVDLQRKQDLLSPIDSQIEELTNRMMDDPTNFSGVDSEIRRLRKQISKELSEGELGAINTRFNEYGTQVKELRAAAKKDPDKFRGVDLDNLIRFRKRNLEAIQFDKSIGSFNHVNLGSQAAYADLEKKGETLGKGYLADVEARTGHKVVTIGGTPYVMSTTGERKEVKAQDVYNDVRTSLLNDAEVVDYFNQQMEIGALTQDQVMGAIDRVAQRAASKFGFKEDKQKSSVKVERGSLADRNSRNRVKESNLVMSRASGTTTQSVGATNIPQAISKRNDMANNLSMASSGMREDNIALLENMVKNGSIDASAAQTINLQQRRLSDMADQFSNAMYLNQDISQDSINQYYKLAAEMADTFNAQPNVNMPNNKLINDQVAQIGNQISAYQLNKRSTDIATGMSADKNTQNEMMQKMNTPTIKNVALSSSMVGDANNAMLEDIKVGVKKMGAEAFLASYGNAGALYLDDNGRVSNVGNEDLRNAVDKKPKIVSVTPLGNRINGINGVPISVQMTVQEPVEKVRTVKNFAGEEKQETYTDHVTKNVSVLVPASSFTDVEGADRIDELNQIVNLKGEINNIRHLYNTARSYDPSGSRSDLYDREYNLSNGMIFKPSASSADRITLRTKDGQTKEIHLNSEQGLKALLQTIQ